MTTDHGLRSERDLAHSQNIEYQIHRLARANHVRLGNLSFPAKSEAVLNLEMGFEQHLIRPLKGKQQSPLIATEVLGLSPAPPPRKVLLAKLSEDLLRLPIQRETLQPSALRQVLTECREQQISGLALPLGQNLSLEQLATVPSLKFFVGSITGLEESTLRSKLSQLTRLHTKSIDSVACESSEIFPSLQALHCKTVPTLTGLNKLNALKIDQALTQQQLAYLELQDSTLEHLSLTLAKDITDFHCGNKDKLRTLMLSFQNPQFDLEVLYSTNQNTSQNRATLQILALVYPGESSHFSRRRELQFDFLEQCPGVHSLDLSVNQYTDLAQLISLKNLRNLRLRFVGPSHFRHFRALGQLNKLETLEIIGGKVNDRQLTALSDLKSLYRFKLRNSSCTGHFLKTWPKTSLKTLNLSDCYELNDNFITQCSQFAELRKITLSLTRSYAYFKFSQPVLNSLRQARPDLVFEMDCYGSTQLSPLNTFLLKPNSAAGINQRNSLFRFRPTHYALGRRHSLEEFNPGEFAEQAMIARRNAEQLFRRSPASVASLRLPQTTLAIIQWQCAQAFFQLEDYEQAQESLRQASKIYPNSLYYETLNLFCQHQQIQTEEQLNEFNVKLENTLLKYLYYPPEEAEATDLIFVFELIYDLSSSKPGLSVSDRATLKASFLRFWNYLEAWIPSSQR